MQRMWRFIGLLPLVHSWWCETSSLTGCRGHPRKLVHKPATEDPLGSFNEFLSDIHISRTDEPIVLDWDNDGDLDVIVRTGNKLVLFLLKESGFVQVEPNPLHNVESPFRCRPAVVDWDGDGLLEVLVGSSDGIKYYKRSSRLRPVRFEELVGDANPFNHIAAGSQCADLSVADWDGDGHLDLLVVYHLSKMMFFQQVNGSLALVEEADSPFTAIIDQTRFRRPVMADWNGDGRMDLLLMAKVLEREYLDDEWATFSGCTVSMYLQQDSGLTKDWHLNPECQQLGAGSGASLVDVDGDGDLDLIVGGDEGPIQMFEHHVFDGVHWLARPRKSQLEGAIHLAQVSLNSTVALDPGLPIQANWGELSGIGNAFKPSLADWNLDGRLDLVLVHLVADDSRFFQQEADGKVIELDSPPVNASCPIDWRMYFSAVDLDQDGDLDLLGFDANYQVKVCLQGEHGYALAEEESQAFHVGLETAPLLGQYYMGYPSFVDWDGDGDVDILKIALDELYFLEHVSNGTFVSHLLPIPKARDFAAADFDGDGDVDLLLSFANSRGCHYFERKGDGGLEEMQGRDNPFDEACTIKSTTTAGQSLTSLVSLGDWNGDGDLDLVFVYDKVKLWTNLGDNQTYVERSGDNLHFPEAVFTSLPIVNFVDADGDGDLDMVIPPQTVLAELGHANYRYFEHLSNGELVERHGALNPFQKAPPGDPDLLRSPRSSHMIADVDGDGKLDILRGSLRYAQQQEDGQFLFVEGPANPFRELQDRPWWEFFTACWTLTDWDQDGDMDLVAVQIPIYYWYKDLKTSLIRGAVSRDFYASLVASQVHFYEQTNMTFVERIGAANPFHSVNLQLKVFKTYLSGTYCPSLVDFDRDGDTDLILENAEEMVYFERTGDTFKRAAHNPFADLSFDRRKTNQRSSSAHPSLFADWDNDGITDIINVHGTRLQYFRRGACSPVTSYCKLGLCNEETAQCECIPGARGHDCTVCASYHVRDGNTCRRCPGYKTVSGTCNRRGVCDDDEDARSRQMAMNESGLKVQAAVGSGQCRCSAPFSGHSCTEGLCPAGQRLERNAAVDWATEKYQRWEACVPCEPGRFKKSSGNDECSLCSTGYIPAPDARSCVACSAGSVPHPNRINCSLCEAGFVAKPGNSTCTGCESGTAPNQDSSECVACADGHFAASRSPKCNICELGSVPDPSSARGTCMRCAGQTYALQKDMTCRSCGFPFMILASVDDNYCTLLYFIAILLAAFGLSGVGAWIYGRIQLAYLKKHLNGLTTSRQWEQVYSLQPSYRKYSLCKGKAVRQLEMHKRDVKLRSHQLGISLDFVLRPRPEPRVGDQEPRREDQERSLEYVYRNTADNAQWRDDDGAPITLSGYKVKVRTMGLPVHDPEASWNSFPECAYPENPNFHQLAGILAYGPYGLGRDQYCPRDGKEHCSIVDALDGTGRSAKATHFLSWVWGYKLQDVRGALRRWWNTEHIVSGIDVTNIYIWWCVFANNQFRMLEQGQTQESDDLFEVFGKQLEGIGKMLMCFDRLNGCVYTERIWCIYEVFVACQRGIKTTLILPEVQVGTINSVADLVRLYRVNAQDATASVAEDARKIKDHIQQRHKGFSYVNQTVEANLWTEVIKHLEATPPVAPEAPVAPEPPVAPDPPSASSSESGQSNLRQHRPPGRCVLQ